MTLSKLSDLKPEQRRVMCAEGIGYVLDDATDSWLKDGRNYFFCSGPYAQIPDPDTDANHALQLVEHLAKEGWMYCVANDQSRGGHIAQFHTADYAMLIDHTADTFQKTVTGCFLLATGKAQL